MNLCFIGAFNGGGTERATFLVAEKLAENNNVYILNNRKNTPLFKLEKCSFTNIKGKNLFDRMFFVFKFIKENSIDYVVTVEAMTGMLTCLPCIMSRTKNIIWEHANYYQNQGISYIQKVRQFELKHSAAYVVLTKRDYNNFSNNFKIKTALKQIYNIADASLKKNEYDIDSKIIISAGHLNKIKNFLIIPDIAKVIFEKHPDWKWHIFGEKEGVIYEQLQKKIEEMHLENNLILCGRSNDMNSEYQKSSFYVMTSLQEGLPMVLLEAKSNGLPIVSFDIETGPDEIICDGENGFLVQPYNKDKMIKKINELIENSSLRQKMSDKSQKDLDLFYMEKIIEKWEKLFENLNK